MSTWNDVRKRTGSGRSLTPQTFKVDTWVCHSISSTWFKTIIMDNELVGGFDIREQEVIVPWHECYHAWDRLMDAKK